MLTALAILVVLAHRKVLCTKVPMHIDWAETRLIVSCSDRREACVEGACVAFGDVRARLLQCIDLIFSLAINIAEIIVWRIPQSRMRWLRTSTRICLALHDRCVWHGNHLEVRGLGWCA